MTLLALGSVVPHGEPSTVTTAPAPVEVADTTCLTTVGDATTDPATATDAARAVAAGYGAADCLPDAAMLAAAEARAAMPLGSPETTDPSTAVSSDSSGADSSGSGSVQTVDAPTTTTTTEAPTTTTTTTTTVQAEAPATTTTAVQAEVPSVYYATCDDVRAAGKAPLPAGEPGYRLELDRDRDGTACDTEATSTTTPPTGTTTETTTTGTTTETTTSASNGAGSGNGGDGNRSSGSGGSGGSVDVTPCTTDTTQPTVATGTETGTTGTAGTTGTTGTAATTGTTDTTGTTTDPTCRTAAETLQWGTPTAVEDFNADLADWSVYDGPGHAGKGRRSPDAMSVSDGIFTITGDSNGTTGGMAWRDGRSKFGRWEARVKSPVADPTYNAVMLLWPDAENWPVGGEVDFMEIGDETRQKVDFFLHYGEDNRQLQGDVEIDATQWHNWAVEWSPTEITGYVDGQKWFTTTDTSTFPPDSMHLTLQLDWFPKGNGSVQQSAMHVDWVRFYPIEGSGDPGEILNSLAATQDTGVAAAARAADVSTDSAERVPGPADGGGSDDDGAGGDDLTDDTSTTPETTTTTAPTTTIEPPTTEQTTTEQTTITEPTPTTGPTTTTGSPVTVVGDGSLAGTTTTTTVTISTGPTTVESSSSSTTATSSRHRDRDQDRKWDRDRDRKWDRDRDDRDRDRSRESRRTAQGSVTTTAPTPGS